MKDDNHDTREKGELQRATNCKEIERAGVTTCYRGAVRLPVDSLGLKTLLELNLLSQKGLADLSGLACQHMSHYYVLFR